MGLPGKQDGAGKRRGCAGEPQVRPAPLRQLPLRQARRPRPAVTCPLPAVSLACFPTQNGSVGPACLHGHQLQVGDRPTRLTPPLECRGSGIGGQGQPEEAGQQLRELGPQAPVHTSPRTPAAPSRDFQGWSRLVLGPPERNLHPGSSLIPGARFQARAGGVAARLVGPEGGSGCDQSRCMCGWVWAESKAARRVTQRPVKPEFQTDSQQLCEHKCVPDAAWGTWAQSPLLPFL